MSDFGGGSYRYTNHDSINYMVDIDCSEDECDDGEYIVSSGQEKNDRRT